MKAIFVRSPYSIVVDFATQIETKVDLYLWNRPNVVPTLPNYTFSMLIPSTTQRTAYYNISNECQEFIENLNPTYIDETVIEQNTMWCYAQAIASYRTTSGGAWTQYSTETFFCLYGYTEYNQGVNYSLNQEITMLNSGSAFTTTYNTTIGLDAVYKPYVNILLQPVVNCTYRIAYLNSEFGTYTSLPTSPTEVLCKIPLKPNFNYTERYTVTLEKYNAGTGVTTYPYITTVYPLCETKYSPILCSFINKMGGWENIWLMKLSEETITAKGTEYNLSPSTFNYNIYKGQSRSFNRNGKKSIKANTGWVDEITSVFITELLMSETIILNNEPVLLTSESQTLKQWVKEKNINYTLEFESKNNLINTVV